MHKTVPHNKKLSAQNVNGTKGEELWAHPLFLPCWQLRLGSHLPIKVWSMKSLIVSSTSQLSPILSNTGEKLEVGYMSKCKCFFVKLTETELKSLSRVRLFATPWTVANHAPLSMGFSSQEYWSGCHFLLQRIFLTQGLNPGLPHSRQTLYRLNHQAYSLF